MPPWFSKEERKRILANNKFIAGIDYEFGSLQDNADITNKVRGDISRLPFKDDCFTLVTSNMVLEHVNDPEMLLREVYRILKPGGLFIFHTPSIYGYTTICAIIIPESMQNILAKLIDGRNDKDVFDTKYMFNSYNKICFMSSKVGFIIDKFRLIVSSAKLIMIPPAVILELLWIRILMTERFRNLRTNIICVLRKPVS